MGRGMSGSIGSTRVNIGFKVIEVWDRAAIVE